MNTLTSPAALSFEVSDADFKSSVLDRSLQVPVLLDIWAPWCGPCKSLGPVLEKLAVAYQGRFVLAKLDSDANPQVAAALRVRSIPQVVLFIGGQPVDQFMGALPENQVRAFLDKHLAGTSEAEQLRQQAADLDPAAAVPLLQQAAALEPDHPEVALDLATALINDGQLDAAAALIDVRSDDPRFAALKARLRLMIEKPPGDADALQARIDANPKDHEARFALAAIQAHEGHWLPAFETLLEVVLRDKAEPRERARTQLVEWFTACGDRTAVDRGRRLLGMYLN